MAKKIATYPRGHPPEFAEILAEKSRDFIGREFVFRAIEQFLQQHDRGYFTLVGSPGSGKSALLAQYVTENPSIAYYNSQVEGKNTVDRFLITLGDRLLEILDDPALKSLPENVSESGSFLSLLLQKVSDRHTLDRPLLIAIDALDEIDRSCQSPHTNLLYLPRYLPENIYFLLSRRPFLRERSALLVEAPAQTLLLEDYPEANRADVKAYIYQFVNKNLTKNNLTDWLHSHQIDREHFIEQLTDKSENNFRYISEILSAIERGFYSDRPDIDRTPPSLATYYQSHCQKMLPSVTEEDPKAKILATLAQTETPLAIEQIAQAIDLDEYEIEIVLEDWIAFLKIENIGGENRYRLYHSDFRDWLRENQPQD